MIPKEALKAIKKAHKEQRLYFHIGEKTDNELECEFCQNKGKFTPVQIYLCESQEERLEDPWGAPGYLIGNCCWKDIKEKLDEAS